MAHPVSQSMAVIPPSTGHRQPHEDENVQPAQQPRRTGLEMKSLLNF